MLLAGVESLLNRHIGESTRAQEYRDRLQDRSLSVALAGTSLGVTLSVRDDTLHVTSGVDQAADVAIETRLLDLPALLEADSADAVRRANAKLRGDLGVAEDYARLLRHARPDLEGELARLIGDIPAHALGTLARGGLRWWTDAQHACEQNVVDYLQAESRVLPNALEMARFARDIERTRDDVARLEQRVERLLRRLAE